MKNNMRFVRSLARILLGWSLLLSLPVFARDYRFDGSMSEDMLRYFLARSYIDIGCEAIHYGQAELMNGNDPKLDHKAEVSGLYPQHRIHH